MKKGAQAWKDQKPGKWLGIAETERDRGSGRSAPLPGEAALSGERNSPDRVVSSHAMTLIELLIVLALLGALATLALTSVGELSARGRVDTTRKRLDIIRTAVVGDGVTAGRFISDMGRYPVVQTSKLAEGTLLSELWETPTGLGYTNKETESLIDGTGSLNWANDALRTKLPETVKLYCGWNGPYATLGGDKLYDGFGYDFQIANTANPATPLVDSEWDKLADLSGGEPVYGILAPGQDGDLGGTLWMEEDRTVVFDNLLPNTSLTVTVKARDNSGDSSTWQHVTVQNCRVDSYDYSLDDMVVDASLTYLFRCSVDTGSSGSTAPSWDTTTKGVSTTPDGNITWLYLGPVDEHTEYINRLYVTLFVPDITETTHAVTWEQDEQSSGTITSTVILSSLKPGIRKLYVHGYLLYGNAVANEHSSGLQTIELKPGANFVTVYLTEKLE